MSDFLGSRLKLIVMTTKKILVCLFMVLMICPCEVFAINTKFVKGGFTLPVGVVFDPLPGGSRMFVIEKGGKVRQAT